MTSGLAHLASREPRRRATRRACARPARRRAALGALAAVGALCSLPGLAAEFPPVSVLDGQPASGRLYLPDEGARETGSGVAAVGDADGDRRSELLIGAPGDQEGQTGRAYLIPGTRGGSSLRELVPGRDGVAELRSGLGSGDRFGATVAGAGDVDGDGLEDFVVGAAPRGHPELRSGAAYLVLGRSLPAVLVLEQQLGSRVWRFAHEGAGASDRPPTAVGVGDLDRDGFDDLALGFPTAPAEEPGGDRAGEVWIVRGGPSLLALPGAVDVSALTESSAIAVRGAGSGAELGASLAGPGDLDGDGIADVAIGAPGAGLGGSVFVIFGAAGIPGRILLDAPGTASTLEIRGSVAAGRLGAAVAGASVPGAGIDATGDGRADLLLGAPGVEREGLPAGAAYLVAGDAALRGQPGPLSVPAAAHLSLRGTALSGVGTALAFVPDSDGDGAGELLLGGPGSRAGMGSAFLVRGTGDAGRQVQLEDLAPPDGVVFLGARSGSNVGAAVCGLPDRSGDGLGEVVVGAPGFSRQGSGARGAVFEIHASDDPESVAPRGLRASLLPGDRVRLSWLVAKRHRSLRVWRDGAPISPPLPGFVLEYTDLGPSPGRHVYFVEADADPGLRSPSIDVEVRRIQVREIACTQVEGTRDVRVTWKAGDLYDDLRVAVDGAPYDGILEPDATELSLELEPGLHRIEVFDPGEPEGFRAECAVLVIGVESEPVEDLTCSAVAPRDVLLRWDDSEIYEDYQVLRDGLLVATVRGQEYRDAGAPPGAIRYSVRGILGGLHRGPEATCEVEADPGPPIALRGKVVWAGEDRPLRFGTVRILEPVVEGEGSQLSSRGEFRIGVPAIGEYRVRLELTLRTDGMDFPPPGGFEQPLVAAEAIAATGREITIEVPPPVLLVSPIGPSESESAAAARWLPLRNALDSRAIAWPVILPGGIRFGTQALENRLAEFLDLLDAKLGSSPSGVDVVALGAAGLTVRTWLATYRVSDVRRLVLLGTPNAGTVRAEIEARAEASGRPPRFVGPRERTDRNETAGSPIYAGALEQTPRFLTDLEPWMADGRRLEVHCVAGTRGRSVLDGVLGCDAHDDRVCVDSALAVEGGVPHTVAEDHETLGRGSASIALVVGDILGLGGSGGGLGDGGGCEVPSPQAEAPDEPAAGSGAGVEPSYVSGNSYIGTVEPGGTGFLPLISDTSESMIIILSSELPGGIRLEVQTPSGDTVAPADAGRLDYVDYQTWGDGEGHDVQLFEFAPSQEGTYVARLENPGTEAVRYTLEAYLSSDFGIQLSLGLDDVLPGEPNRVEATLTRRGVPETGAAVSARVARPDGQLDLMDLVDDGTGADLLAGDGVYAAEVPATAQPGFHQVEVTATEPDPIFATFQREAATWYRVWSDVAKLTGEFVSGAEDDAGDGVMDDLWVEAGIESVDRGFFVASGTLTDLDGAPIATAGTAFALPGPARTTFRLYFEGPRIHAARRPGPWLLSEIWIHDGSAGFVPADHRTAAHTTEALAWEAFGAQAALHVRGDATPDGKVDISDGIAVLVYLFSAPGAPSCLSALDANDDGQIDVADPISIFGYLFLGAEAPPAPFPACGVGGRLGCVEHPPCGG